MQGHGFDPWSGKITRAWELLNPNAAATKASAPTGCALEQGKPPQGEARSLQLEKAKTQHSQKEIHTYIN